MKFIRWNCRGYYPNFEELAHLIATYKLKAIVFWKSNYAVELFYATIRIENPANCHPLLCASQGVLRSCFMSLSLLLPSPLHTHLHVVAARIHLDSKLTVCSNYLAPSCSFYKADLFALFRQLPSPF